MSQVRTGDPALMREMNLSIVLNALRDHSAPSRASLALATGLTKATVSHLVEQLSATGLVSERGTGPHGLGRPRILLQLNPQAGSIIGVEVGVDFISVLVTDFAPHVVWRYQERTEQHASQAKILEQTIQALGAARAEAERRGLPVLGMALGVPGLVDVESGTLLYAPNLRWRNLPLRQRLSESFDFPIYVDNEATLAAFGEMYFGIARGARNMVFVTAGVGLGGGLVLDGHLVTGASGFAGEVGHMTLEPEGRLCNCGNRGCWETLASQAAVFRRVQEIIGAGKPSLLERHDSEGYESLTIPMVVHAADEGDDVAREALAETGKYLGIGIANLVNALNPDMVVLGGILSVAKDYLMPVVRQTIQERALRWSSQATQLAVAANGSDACVMGGVAIIYDQILRHPLQAHLHLNSELS